MNYLSKSRFNIIELATLIAMSLHVSRDHYFAAILVVILGALLNAIVHLVGNIQKREGS